MLARSISTTRNLVISSTNRLRRIKQTWQRTKESKAISYSMPETFLFHLTMDSESVKKRIFRFCWQRIVFSGRHSDYITIKEVLLNQEYKFILSILASQPSPQVVIDGGANIGLFSIYVLANCPNAEIHAVEPSNKTFSLLAHNRDLNRLERWHVYHAALWESDQEVRFTDTESSISSHVENIQKRNLGYTYSVPGVRLRTFIDEYVKFSGKISLLKLDIEGAEESVLIEGEEVLSRVENLIVEIHPEYINKQNIINIITRYFPYIYHIKESTRRPYILASRIPHSTISTV
jgi:FkbM family methyltransferase